MTVYLISLEDFVLDLFCKRITFIAWITPMCSGQGTEALRLENIFPFLIYCVVLVVLIMVAMKTYIKAAAFSISSGILLGRGRILYSKKHISSGCEIAVNKVCPHTLQIVKRNKKSSPTQIFRANSPEIPQTQNQFITVSANVYQTGTLISWKDREAGDVLGAWSSMNWLYFQGVASLRLSEGETVTFLLVASPVQGACAKELPIRSGREFEMVKGDLACGSVTLMEKIRAHCRENHEALALSHTERLKEQEGRRAELIANPPVENDIVIQYRALSEEEIAAHSK